MDPCCPEPVPCQKGNKTSHPLTNSLSALQEYNSEAAFAAAVLLSFLALFTLVVKDRLEGVASQETSK